MGIKDYNLSDMANNEMLNFSMYTITSRALPNMIDGLKPVQRFYLYSSIKNSRTEFKKVSAVAGVISDYGYNHAETSAQSTGQLMAATWNNNICLIQGRGAFGSRAVPAAGAPRYVYTKVHDNFGKYITDLSLSPVHPDPEHEPPKFYLPSIPLVLANGAKGIATGFATNILPRSEQSLIECCEEYAKTGKVTKLPAVSFPEFTGTTFYDADKDRWVARGKFTWTSKNSIEICEIPPDITREDYILKLEQITQHDDINDFQDACDEAGFRFLVNFKRGHTFTDDAIYNLFKLEKSFSENISVIGPDDKLRIYQDPRKLIEDFCEYRLGILRHRIDDNIAREAAALDWTSLKIDFINAVLDEKLVFKGRSKPDVVSQIISLLSCNSESAESLLKMPMGNLTKEQVDHLLGQKLETEDKLNYWKTTATPAEQFLKDLSAL